MPVGEREAACRTADPARCRERPARMLAASPGAKAQRAFAPVAALLLFAYPMIVLVIPGGMNTAFFLLLLGSLTVWTTTRLDPPGKLEAHDPLTRGLGLAYAWAMAGLPLAVFVGEVTSHLWGWQRYDAVSRFLLAVPIFWCLRRLRTDLLSRWRLGVIAGAGVGLGAVVLDPRDWGSGRLGTSFVNPIHFGDIALTLGMLAVAGAGWSSRRERLLTVASVGALLAGIVASALSGSRGGWVALPGFALFGWLELRRRLSRLQAGVVFVALVAALAGVYGAIPEIHQRIGLIVANLRAYAHGHDDTSIGIRFQLWKAAWLLFTEHPLFGVGMGGFKAMMTPLQQAGVLTPLAADFGRQEVHNEILSRLSQLGLVGLAAILAVYLVPGWMFLRRLNDTAADVRAAARMGLILVWGFFVYGLTVETFDLTMTAAFYALTVAVLLALTYPRVPRDPAPCSAS